MREWPGRLHSTHTPGLSGTHGCSAMLSQHPPEIEPPLSELAQTEKRVALPTAHTHTSRQLSGSHRTQAVVILPCRLCVSHNINTARLFTP